MLIIFPIIGFFLGIYYNQSKSIELQNSDITANWKTYTNSDYSFRYPDNLTYSTLTNGVVVFSDNQNKRKFSFNGFSIGSLKNNNLVDPKVFTDSQGRTWETDMVLGEVYNYTGILKQNGNVYKISLQSGPGEITMINGATDDGHTFRDFADQILSTFKFTNK